MPQRAAVDSVYDFYVVQRVVYYVVLCLMFPVFALQIWAESNDFTCCAKPHRREPLPSPLPSATNGSELSNSGSSQRNLNAAGTGTGAPGGSGNQPATYRPVPKEARGQCVAWITYWLRRLGVLQCTLLLAWNADLSGSLGLFSRPVTHLMGNWAITIVFVMLSLWTIANVNAQYQQTRQRRPKLFVAFVVALPAVFFSVSTVSAVGLIVTDTRWWQAIENLALCICCLTYAVIGAVGYVPLRRSLVAFLDRQTHVSTEHVRAALNKLTAVFVVVFVALVAVAANSPFDFQRNITYSDPLRPPSDAVDKGVAAYNVIYLLTVLVPLLYTFQPVRCCPDPPKPDDEADALPLPPLKRPPTRSPALSPRAGGATAPPELAIGSGQPAPAPATLAGGGDGLPRGAAPSVSVVPPPPPRTASMSSIGLAVSAGSVPPPPPTLPVLDEHLDAHNRSTGSRVASSAAAASVSHSRAGSAAAAAGAAADAAGVPTRRDADEKKRGRHSRQMPLLPEVLKLYSSRAVLDLEDAAARARARMTGGSETDTESEPPSLPADADVPLNVL